MFRIQQSRKPGLGAESGASDTLTLNSIKHIDPDNQIPLLNLGFVTLAALVCRLLPGTKREKCRQGSV